MEVGRGKLPSEIETLKKQKPCINQNLSCSSLSRCSSSYSSGASIDLLPPEMITNILSRLHFKSIAQCKCVSKLWYSILSDSTTFPTTTIQLSQLSTFTPDLFLRFKTQTTRSQSSRIYYLEDSLALSKRRLRPLKLIDESSIAQSFPYDAYVVGSCSGFVCYLTSINDITSAVTEFPSIYVFNPLTEERFKLPPLPIQSHHKPYIRQWLCGFGFDDSENQFKFVFIMNIYTYRNVWSPFKLRYNQVLVHTLGTTSWTTKTDIVPFQLFRSKENASSAFVGRSLHWNTHITPFNTFKGISPAKHYLHIVSFNLGTLEFESVPTPESYVFTLIPNEYRLWLLEDRLSFLDHSYKKNESIISIWVMNKYNVRESWVKLFSIQGMMCSPPKPIKLLKTGELLLLCEDQDMVAYHPIKQKTRRISLGWPGKRQENLLEIYQIVGTHVSVKAAFGVGSDMGKGKDDEVIPEKLHP